MAVSSDKYELPICVADSARELAGKMGVNKYAIYQRMCRQRKGIYCKDYIVRKVEVQMMKEITIRLSEEEYQRVMAVAGRRHKHPASLFKHIMFQLHSNDEISDYTGKRKSDVSVIKRNSSRRRK